MKPLRSLPALAAAATLCLAVAHAAGDGPTPTPTPSPSASASPNPATAEIAADVATHAKHADDLWAYIKKWSNTDDLEKIDQNLDEDAQMAKAQELIAGKVAHLQPAVAAFLKQYPQDPHRWEVRLLRISFLREAEHVSEDEVAKTLQEVGASDAPIAVRQEARGALLQTALRSISPATGLTDALEKELSAYEKDFPDDAEAAQLVDLRLNLLQSSAPEKIVPVLTTLSKSPNKAVAETAAKALAIRTQPLDLKFTALDGKEVDFAKLRGKVVLLDFWATWCGPCMAKLPEIVDIQKKYKDKDFQLIGISLDEDKGELEKTVKAKGMDWPQNFDGKGWKSDVAQRFGVTGIPATWLVDKKGLVHEVDRGADLDAEIAKLLDAEAKK